jgi:hypothetical protein
MLLRKTREGWSGKRTVAICAPSGARFNRASLTQRSAVKGVLGCRCPPPSGWCLACSIARRLDGSPPVHDRNEIAFAGGATAAALKKSALLDRE